MTQKMIFMGSKEHTERECKKLHEKLDEALSWLSGLQQLTPGRVADETWVEEQNQGSEEIMKVIEDIALALGATVTTTCGVAGSYWHAAGISLEVSMKREEKAPESKVGYDSDTDSSYLK